MIKMVSLSKYYLRWLTLLIMILVGTVGCKHEDKHSIRGHTMGTTYQITIVDKLEISIEDLQQKVEQRLAKINQQMSTYQGDSELSRFNRHISSEPFLISSELHYVVQYANKAFKLTEGAFDPSIHPLVELWGFGRSMKFIPPDSSAINTALQHTGLSKLNIHTQTPQLSKHDPKLSIDLSAIAKGYAVDVLAELLEQKGISNYLVEIGGEISAKGRNTQGKLWRIGIEKPSYRLQDDQPATLQGIELDNTSVATSGNYRNYYEHNGKRYAHTLNPKTGRPSQNQLASVTVLHSSAMWADAMATAIMVMGEEKGMEFAEQHKLAVFMMIHHQNAYRIETNQRFRTAMIE